MVILLQLCPVRHVHPNRRHNVQRTLAWFLDHHGCIPSLSWFSGHNSASSRASRMSLSCHLASPALSRPWEQLRFHGHSAMLLCLSVRSFPTLLLQPWDFWPRRRPTVGTMSLLFSLCVASRQPASGNHGSPGHVTLPWNSSTHSLRSGFVNSGLIIIGLLTEIRCVLCFRVCIFVACAFKSCLIAMLI